VKKLYIATLTIVLITAAAFIGYGIYLNRTSNVLIETGITQYSVLLYGVEARYRDIYPMLALDNVSFSSRSMTDVISEVSGTLEKMFVAPGEMVKKGQILCEIVSPTIALEISIADMDIAKAQIAYSGAKTTFEMNKNLYSQDAISKNELDSSEINMKTALADVTASKAKRAELDRTRIKQRVTAPIDGNVLLRYLQYVGDQVGKGDPIMLIGELSPLLFTETIAADDAYALIPFDRNAEYNIHIAPIQLLNRGFAADTAASRDHAGNFSARIVSMKPLASHPPSPRTVTWQVDNPHGDLGPNMYTNVILTAKTPRRVLCVPQEAIQETIMDKNVIFVEKNGVLASLEVKTGVYDDEFIEISEGLSAGDVVIISGVSHVLLGSKVKVIPIYEE
jgi:RND family efflux transporter MFP subunit